MPTVLPVDRRAKISVDEFLRDYARPGRPLVLTGLTRCWAAQQRWTFEFFREHYGHLTVEVRRETLRDRQFVAMSMGDYIDYLLTTREDSPLYLASWDFMEVAPELRADFQLPEIFADDWLLQVPAEIRPRLLWLFIGPARTGFRLHQDVGHTAAWNIQISGRKRWAFFPADQKHNLYYGRVDAFAPDLERFPNFQRASGYECVQEAGEAVFTPSTWWHQTCILEPSIAVSGNYANASNLEPVLAWLAQNPIPGLAEALQKISLAGGM